MQIDKDQNYINIDQDYLEIIKLDVREDHLTKKLYICPSVDSGQYGTFRIPLEEFSGTLIPYHLGIYQGKLDEYAHKLRLRFFDYASFVKFYISGASDENLEIKALIEYLCKELTLPQKAMQILIKLFISGKDLIPLKKGKKIFVKPSREISAQGKRRKFLTSIIDELIEKSNRVELLINHGGVIGSYREDLLINLIMKYLPSKFSVSSGFIEGCSRQIDIIVYDSHNYIPLFKENNIVVVRLESVRAIIEVKTTLDQKELDNSIQLLHSLGRYNQPVIPIFKGIFAFKATYEKPEKIAKRLIEYYDQNSTGWSSNKLEYLFQCFDSICVLNKMFIFSSHVFSDSSSEKKLLPHINTVVDKYHFNTSGAYFLERLFSYFDVENNSRRINNDYFYEIKDEAEVKFLGFIHNEGWLRAPQIIGRSVLESDQDFKDRHNSVVSWMHGEISTDDLVAKYSRRIHLSDKGH